MLKLIFFGLILFFGYRLKIVDRLKFGLASLEEFTEKVSAMPQARQTSPAVRSLKMEAEFGTPWDQWDPQAIENSVFDHPTLRTPETRRYFGSMDMEVAGDQISIYDLELGPVDVAHDTGKYFQTVISIKPRELRLPPFIIRPKSILNGEFLTREVAIKSESPLDVRFALETLVPHRTKALFQSELGTEVLIPFLNDYNWTVQWTGKSLIVYEFNRLIDPERLHEVALEVSEFFDLLKLGPAVIDQAFEELIRETAQGGNSRHAIGIKRR